MGTRNALRRQLWIWGTACFAIASSAVASAAGGAEHEFVRIHHTRLRPAVLHLKPGQPIGWLNQTGRVARVSFDGDAARSMVCRSETGFRLTGSELQSARIHSRQFASLCSLAPGEYHYRVDLGNGLSGDGSFRSLRALEGTVVVD